MTIFISYDDLLDQLEEIDTAIEAVSAGNCGDPVVDGVMLAPLHARRDALLKYLPGVREAEEHLRDIQEVKR